MKIVNKKSKIYLLLIFAMIFYSLTGIFSKLASYEKFLSVKYIFYYVCIVGVLAVYAIFWQQILKKIELSVAMSFKPLVIIMNFVWGIILFKSVITYKIIFGFICVFIGIILVGGAHE